MASRLKDNKLKAVIYAGLSLVLLMLSLLS